MQKAYEIKFLGHLDLSHRAAAGKLAKLGGVPDAKRVGSCYTEESSERGKRMTKMAIFDRDDCLL